MNTKILKRALEIAAVKVATITEALGECPSDELFRACCEKNKEEGCVIKQAAKCYMDYYINIATAKIKAKGEKI